MSDAGKGALREKCRGLLPLCGPLNWNILKLFFTC